MDANFKLAQSIQEKFEFYIIALVFTLLGLSIQTASTSGCNIQSFIEILGWGALLLSGITGLWRMEYKPVILMHHSYQERDLKKINSLETDRIIDSQTKKEIKQEDIDKLKKSLGTKTQTRESIIREVESTNKIKYQLHRWSFILGLVCIMTSRVLSTLHP